MCIGERGRELHIERAGMWSMCGRALRARGQCSPEENRKSKAACVMSSCGGGGFRAHKASYLSWRHARASKSGSMRSSSMRRAHRPRTRARPTARGVRISDEPRPLLQPTVRCRHLGRDQARASLRRVAARLHCNFLRVVNVGMHTYPGRSCLVQSCILICER